MFEVRACRSLMSASTSLKPTNFRGELGEDLAEGVLGAAQRAVGVLSHGHVVVHVHVAAGEAVGKEAGGEEREIAEAAQPGPLFGAAGLERAGEPNRQRLAVIGVAVVEPHVAAQQVHEVVLGEVAGLQMLPRQGGLDLFLEVLDGRLLAQVHMAVHEASSHGRYGPAARLCCNTHS